MVTSFLFTAIVFLFGIIIGSFLAEERFKGGETSGKNNKII